MTSNHVGDLFADGSAGFGFGVAVVRSPGEFGEMSSPGSFFWNGFFGTHFWVDPQEELVFVLMKQQYPFHTGLRNRFRTLVYQAIED